MAKKKSGKSVENKKEKMAQMSIDALEKGGKKAVRKIPKRYRRTLFHRIFPYVTVVFAVILTICYVTVWALEMGDEGAGVVGYAIQAFFCGMLGGLPAFLLPLSFGYAGLAWCVFHVKWQERDANAPRESDAYADYKKARRKTVLNTVLVFVLVLLISAAVAVFTEPELDPITSFELGTEELISGGILGDTLAYFFIFCFQTVVSEIILVLLILLSFLFLAGLTPDYIITKIRYQNALRREAREREEEEWARQYEEAQKAIPAKKKEAAVLSAPPAQPAPKEEKKGKKRSMMTDEVLEEEPGAEEEQVQTFADPEPEIVITIPEEKKDEEEKSVGEDYGGDPAFDTAEYASVDSVFAGLKNNKQPAAPAVQPEEIHMGEIGTDELLADLVDVDPEEGEADGIDEPEPESPYVFPSIELLEKNRDTAKTDYTEEMNKNARILVETLKSFRVGVQSINCSRGPTITRYELRPEVGTRVRSIANLVDDISLSLATSGVRIEAPIPGKAAVGIEVPNEVRATVYLRELLEDSKFTEAKSRLTAALGKDVGGNPIYFDIAKMPHLLIAGATGMGKSVCINCLIVSLLYKAKPSELKLILIDPKKVEFAIYKDIPHLYAPIVSEPKKAAGALASAVAEMERRFELIEQAGVRDIGTYNASIENDPDKERMPHMVIIIDELADLMMTAPDEVESSICRLAQKARAAGIHLVIGTQRPSVDVITGLIKANIPSRCACTVASQVDSRTIIDIAGAEKLIGRGDMLFAPVGCAKPMRVQGAFVSEGEVEKIVSFLRENNAKAKYNNDFISRLEEEAAKCGMGKKGAGGSGSDMNMDVEVEGGDEKFRDAVKLAIEEGKISTSLMQRRLGVGYGRAAKIIDTMEQMGYVSKPDGNKPRRVLITMEEYMRRVVDGNLGGVEE